MRLSKFSKKMIAYVCAIAMVVAGLAFIPAADTKADAPDWSTIDYLGDGAGGGQYTNKYKYYCEDGSAVNIQKPGFADEAGIYANFPGADIQMDIDGYAVQGAGAVLYLSNFTKKVTEINVTYAGGSTKAYVYYEDGEEGPTTTVDPSASTAEPTTSDPWKSIPNGGTQWYYNNATKKNITSVVNIQTPPWAGEEGVYITVPAGISEVNVNGSTEGVAAIDGAGFVVYLSAMTKKINEVTVTQGLGTSSIQIKNENGSEETTEAPTETPTEETTEAPTETPTEETTEAPTEAPTEETTEAPTEAPTEETTEAPTQKPQDYYDGWVDTDRNLALLGTASDKGTHREGSAEQINDGTIDSYANHDAITVDATHPDGSFDIELDKAYDAASIDQVVIYWRSASPFYPENGYTVQFGYKGVFSTVATVTKDDYPTEGIVPGEIDAGRFVTDSDFTADRLPSSAVDTVRIYCNSTAAWGAQVREICVFSENPQDAPTLPQADNPAGITASSPDYGTIAYSIQAGEGQEDYTYNVYANDSLFAEGVLADTEYIATGFAPGDYTLKVVSFAPAHEPSDGINSDPVTVANPVELFYSPKNVAPLGIITAVSSFYNESYDLNTSQCAIDGTPVAGEDADKCLRTGANVDATIDIDLGMDYNVKDLQKVALAYTNPRTDASITEIGISSDGETYYQAAKTEGYSCKTEGQLDVNILNNDIKDPEGTFRYVRINLSGGDNGWGFVVNQIGIIVDPGEEPTTEAPTETQTEEPTTAAPTETQTEEPTTQAPTEKPTEAPTVKPTAPKPIPVIKYPDKAKVKKATKKKKSAKKIKIKLKKIKGAKGYQVAAFKSKKKAKKKNGKALAKKFFKKVKFTWKNKKFKKKKKLYVKVRAYTLDGKTKVYGAWSKPKKVKIKKK